MIRRWESGHNKAPLPGMRWSGRGCGLGRTSTTGCLGSRFSHLLGYWSGWRSGGSHLSHNTGGLWPQADRLVALQARCWSGARALWHQCIGARPTAVPLPPDNCERLPFAEAGSCRGACPECRAPGEGTGRRRQRWRQRRRRRRRFTLLSSARVGGGGRSLFIDT